MMWAIRTNPLRGRAFIIRSFQNLCPNSLGACPTLHNKAYNGSSHMALSDRCTCLKTSYCAVHSFTKSSFGCRGFSSQAGSKVSSEEEDEFEDAFSELENLSEIEKEPSSEPDIFKEEEKDLCEGTKEPQDELLVSDSEELEPKKRKPKEKISVAFFNAILDAPSKSFESVVDKWVKDGKELDQFEIAEAIFILRQRNMFARALQVLEWLESSSHIEFGERLYSTRLDLIAKVHGLHAAESYINKIPEPFKNEVIYRTFLSSCVSSNNIKKSEAVFNKMKDLGFSLSVFSCNQMLLLYKRNDKKKVADVLLLMEKKNLKPTGFTYGILVDLKGESCDIRGMEQIVETMKEEGVEPDLHVQLTLARHYVNFGFNEKAESILREIEGDDLSERKWACNVLLPIYGSLKKTDDVARVWKVCESNPRHIDCIAATIAWGRIGNVEKAEEAFEKGIKIAKKLSMKHCSALLRLYANHKMLKKGKDLVTRMAESGITIGPLIWDDLVRLHVFAGELEKADTILQKVTQQSEMKPFVSSYIAIMEGYSKNGDVHNTEKIFYMMRQSGYILQNRQFESLIRAYVNADVPAYGIRERMKGDNVFPSPMVTALMTKVDPFRKTPVSALLD